MNEHLTGRKCNVSILTERRLGEQQKHRSKSLGQTSIHLTCEDCGLHCEPLFFFRGRRQGRQPLICAMEMQKICTHIYTVSLCVSLCGRVYVYRRGNHLSDLSMFANSKALFAIIFDWPSNEQLSPAGLSRTSFAGCDHTLVPTKICV